MFTNDIEYEIYHVVNYSSHLGVQHAACENQVHGSWQPNQLRQPHSSAVDERDSKSVEEKEMGNDKSF